MESKALGIKHTSKVRFFYGYVIVLISFLIMATMFGMIQSFGVFLKPITADFNWSRAATSGPYSMFAFLMGFFALFTGRLTDRFGPRIVATACALLFGLGHLLMSQLNSIWQIYLLYGVISAGTSGGFIPLASTVARWFTKKRGLMIGIASSGIGAGAIIFPPVVGWLIDRYEWRTAYFVSGIAALLLLTIVAQFLKREPGETGQSSEANTKFSSTVGGSTLEEALRTRHLWFLSASYLCSGFGAFSIIVHVVPYATDFDIPIVLAANILTVIGILNTIGRLGAGILADKIGNKPTLIIGLLLMALPIFLLQFIHDLWMLYILAAVFGFGWGAPGTIISPIVAELFGLRAHGSIMSVVNFGGTIGAAAGTYFTALIFDVSGNYILAFWICTILTITSMLLVFSFRTPKQAQPGSNA